MDGSKGGSRRRGRRGRVAGEGVQGGLGADAQGMSCLLSEADGWWVVPQVSGFPDRQAPHVLGTGEL